MKRTALLLLLLAAGCGGGDESAPVGGTSTPVTEAPPAETQPATTETEPAETTPTEPPLPLQEGLPPAVESTRQEIYRAATERDLRALRRLIPDTGFTYTYGLPDPGGPVAYWRTLEDSGEAPFNTMAGLLALEHTRARDIYVWPWAYDKNPADFTDAQKEALAAAGAATVEQLDQMAEFGHYLGWRIGIRQDGTWIFFVAGD